MSKVLIVDDDPVALRLLNAILKSGGFTVLAASDPIQGFRLAIEKRPDVILLDLEMPAGGGGGFLDNLRENLHTALIPVIVISAHGDPEIREACAKSGVSDFISKPFRAARVLQSLRRILAANAG